MSRVHKMVFLDASKKQVFVSEYPDPSQAVFRSLQPETVSEAEYLRSCDWLESANAYAERPQAPEGQQSKSSGSGVVISVDGLIATTYHVVLGCNSIFVLPIGGADLRAIVVAKDSQADLALLRVDAKLPEAALLREARPILGEGVTAVGFPLSGLLADQVNVTAGVVSALAGIRNDSRLLQITAPVQAGNSGGPVLDDMGRVLGIVVSKLDAARIYNAVGDLPQNINFAIKASAVISFLDANNVAFSIASPTAAKPVQSLATLARRITVKVSCH